MAKIILPLTIMPIDNDGFHLLTEIRLNGKKASVIVDTGASRTVFDKARIKHFVKTRSTKIKDKLSTGLGTSEMESHHIVISSVTLGKARLRNYATILLDLSHVNHSYSMLGLAEVDGVLGSDILHKYGAVIDYAASKLILHPPKAK